MRKIEMAMAIVGTDNKKDAEVKRLMRMTVTELEDQYNELFNNTKEDNTMTQNPVFMPATERPANIEWKYNGYTEYGIAMYGLPMQEAENVTSTNPETTEPRIATTEAVSLFQRLANQFGWKLWIPRKCDGIVAKEDKDRVLELYWTADGFDLYMRNDLFDDIAALVEKHAIPVVHKFRKGWNMQNRYSVTEANAVAFLDMLATL